mmetsp:Transcript_112791/g.224356  ORF Transcript_112791/g.224356 Transcript_112791/m.224356 type:complete len:256 (-) Transcript_112791:243-1010(-)|eukprot:CAMPEP_0172679112 /NCGR_PEP_ID=MMETSP1074-20121228/15843_1 /TAXON_ID=2916 /ORGANISM="Ceratium fusus, Strain PA161109" /LENGTH=255 /DNA_ID=CAMNT_0013497237 /DNA_START=149 /DNA_END=916 /DNA_ORIENTATION=+
MRRLSSPAASVTCLRERRPPLHTCLVNLAFQLRSARTHEPAWHNLTFTVQLLDAVLIHQVNLPLCRHMKNLKDTLNLRGLLSNEAAAARCGRTVTARGILIFWFVISACHQVFSRERLHWYNRTTALSGARGAPQVIASNARPPASAPRFRIWLILFREFERHELLLPKVFLVTFLISTPAGTTESQTPRGTAEADERNKGHHQSHVRQMDQALNHLLRKLFCCPEYKPVRPRSTLDGVWLPLLLHRGGRERTGT